MSKLELQHISNFKVKEVNGDNYLVILESEDGKERHYWSPDGSYDGHDFKVLTKKEEK